MATIITVHGFPFALESDGFNTSAAEECRDRGYDAIETALKRMDRDKVAKLHAADLRWTYEDGSRPAGLNALNAIGTAEATKGWHDPSVAGIFVNAYATS